jgi:hypothetical protein
MKMTDNQRVRVIKLLPSCCNYCDGQCLRLDDVCPQAISLTKVNCSWFRNAVLALEPVLEADLRAYNSEGTGTYEKTCKGCGKQYKSLSRTQQYCEPCKGRIKRMKHREHQRAYQNKTQC